MFIMIIIQLISRLRAYAIRKKGPFLSCSSSKFEFTSVTSPEKKPLGGNSLLTMRPMYVLARSNETLSGMVGAAYCLC
jgi:hypothetical protein